MIESRPTVALSVSTSRVSTGLAEPTHSVWHVFTEVGTQVMTLPALEAALQHGDVRLSTLVWVPGMVEWEPLGAVANLCEGSFVAPGRQQLADGPVATRQGRHEQGQRSCNCARSHNSRTNAQSKTLRGTAAKEAYGGRKRHPWERSGLRRWRPLATLATVLLLMLLGGRRLADAVAQQQRSTALEPTLPAESAQP